MLERSYDVHLHFEFSIKSCEIDLNKWNKGKTSWACQGFHRASCFMKIRAYKLNGVKGNCKLLNLAQKPIRTEANSNRFVISIRIFRELGNFKSSYWEFYRQVLPGPWAVARLEWNLQTRAQGLLFECSGDFSCPPRKSPALQYELHKF